MTRFEKHKKLDFNQWVEKMKTLRDNVYTFSYKGYDVLTFSQKNRGCGYKLFKNNVLIRERYYAFYKDFNNHIRRYIDNIN